MVSARETTPVIATLILLALGIVLLTIGLNGILDRERYHRSQTLNWMVLAAGLTLLLAALIS
jgi:amino acid transporter